MSIQSGVLSIKTALDNSLLEKGLKQLGNDFDGAGQKSKGFSDLAATGMKVVATAAAAVTASVTGLVASAVSVGSTFEASMSQVAATMGISADAIQRGSAEFDILEKAARECGETTKYSASQAAEALNYLALAGYDAEKAAATLPKVLNLAAAGGMELGRASDLVTDSMAALGMETNQLDQYIDEMARTAQKSNTSVEQLGEATITVAGMISTTGQSLETMNAELGILANNGIKGSEGGTKLRNVLLSLSSPTKEASQAMKSINLEVYDAEGNMRDLNDILTDMNASMDSLTQQDRTNIINTIFNKADVAAVNALLKGTGDEFNNLVEELHNSAGAAAEMAAVMNDNLNGKITILKSSMEGLGISVYKIFEGTMKGAVETATNSIGKLQKEVSGGKLGNSLTKLSKQFAQLAEKALDFATKALPVLVDGLSWLIENGQVVISVIAGIAAAHVAMSVIPAVINALSAAWAGYELVAEGAATVTEVLNLVMNLNPAVLLTTAIVGLTAAFGAYVLMGGDAARITDDAAEAQLRLAESAHAQNDAFREANAEMHSNRDAMEMQSEHARKLAKELEGLRGASDPASIKRQKEIIAELNTIMPELNASFDENTHSVNLSTEALERNVKALMREAMAAAVGEDLQRIANDRYEADKKLLELQKQKDALYKEHLVTQQKISSAEHQMELDLENEGRVLDSTRLMVDELNVQYEEEGKRLDALDDAISDTTKAQEELETEFSETVDYQDDLQTSTDDLGDSVDDLGDSVDGVASAFDRLSEAEKETLEDLSADWASAIDSQIDVFEKWDQSIEQTSEDLKKNLDSQLEGLTNWASNLDSLAQRGVGREFYQFLANMGPEGAGYVQRFVDMSDEALRDYIDTWGEVKQTQENTLMQMQDDWAFTDEVTVGDDIVSKPLTEAVENGTKEASAKAQEGTKEVGQKMDEGTAEGVEENQDEVTQAMETVTESTVQKAQETMSSGVFNKIGVGAMNGLINGIASKQGALAAAIMNACNNAVQQAISALGSVGGTGGTLGGNTGATGTSSGKIGGTGASSAIGRAIGNAVAGNQLAMAGAIGGSSVVNNIVNNASNSTYDSGRSDGNVNVNVVLEGDAQGVFRLVRQENRKYMTSTGRNGLATV